VKFSFLVLLLFALTAGCGGPPAASFDSIS
jgi:hypothetical protein